MSLLYRTARLTSLLALVFFAACEKDDDLRSGELLVFVKGEYGATNNAVTASLIQTPLAVWGNRLFEIPVYATREVPAEVKVSVTPDDRFVSKFNSDNNLKCVLLPAANYKINSGQLTISAGAAISDPLKIEILNPASLTDTNGYVLPLTISKIEGKDKGIQISTNLATAYLHVPYTYTNIDSTQQPLTGTSMSRTTWSVTVSNTTSGALGPAMLDGNNSTSWRSSNSSTAAKWVVLNMGAEQTVKGFQLVPNYVSTSENPIRMTIFTSNDNTSWTRQGVWIGTGPAAASSAASPDIKGVNFVSPVTARYFRFEINAQVSGNRVGIGEVNAIQ
jgi:hypothetical protein